MTKRRTLDFDEHFTLSFDACCAAARRITGDGGVAEELAAEAFVRAWVRWPWLSRQRSPAGWVIRVTTNLAIDHVRRGAAPALARPETPAPEDAVVVRMALVEALRRLSARQRQAVSLHYLVGMDQHEVAAAMGLSSGSVKTHLHRARAHLRESLSLDDADLEVRLAP